MSIFHFKARDLLSFSTVSSHCWTEFAGYLSSYKCRDFSSVSRQVKFQGYACSRSKETMFCKSCVFDSLVVVTVIRRANKTG